MPQRPQCQVEDELIHKGFDKTGRTKTDRRTNVTWEIWQCQCGRKKLEVIPGTKRDW